MTGGWHHSSFGNFLLYAVSLLFGKRGFIGHNLPLFLSFPGTVYLLRQRGREIAASRLRPALEHLDLGACTLSTPRTLGAMLLDSLVPAAAGAGLF